MHSGAYRWLLVATASLLVAACSTTPTSPSSADRGPALSQGPLAGLIPQGPPPVPPRIAAPMPSALGATRFLAFGDSITYGVMSSSDGSFEYDVPGWSYPVRLRSALDQYHAGGDPPRRYSVTNAGVSGEWAVHGAARIQSAITEYRPQALLLLEGINDLSNGQSIAQTVNALGQIVDRARANNVTVLIATMMQTYEFTHPETGVIRENSKDLVVPFNNEIKARFLGRQTENIHVVDLYAAFGTDRSLMGGDGLHPTDAGFERMATTFLSAIEAVFGIRGSFQ
jgi:lysophospholipase L1-like esterase